MSFVGAQMNVNSPASTAVLAGVHDAALAVAEAPTVAPLRLVPPKKPHLGYGVRGRYGCGACQEAFISLVQLAKHMQFHDRSRPFPCAVCGKRFLSRSHHAEHQRVHTGERPFPCDRCERSFTTHHNLKRHQMIHDKEEMFRCPVCGILFCQDHGLSRLLGAVELPDVTLPPEDSQPEYEPLPKLRISSKHKTKDKKRKKKKKHHKKHHKQQCKEEEHFPIAEEKNISTSPSFQASNATAQASAGLQRKPVVQRIAYDIEVVL